jgi:uncharacterized protein with HEPN domain
MDRISGPGVGTSGSRRFATPIARGYETVDHRLVWQVLIEDLPALAGAVEQLLIEG